jgi:sorting and assembly machinery component 37
VLLAAHILVLTGPHYPDPLLQTLLSDSYPRLFEHARHIQSLALGDDSALPRVSAAPRLPLTSLLPWPRWSTAADPLAELPEWQAVERRFAIQRWTWIAAAVTSTVGYLAYVRMHRILAELARESR